MTEAPKELFALQTSGPNDRRHYGVKKKSVLSSLPPAMLLSFSEKVKFGQSTVLVVVDETPMPLAA
jgi:hypothetical protein